jgi:hypothetical protein
MDGNPQRFDVKLRVIYIDIFRNSQEVLRHHSFHPQEGRPQKIKINEKDVSLFRISLCLVFCIAFFEI